MSNYGTHVSLLATDQKEQAKSNQVQNNEGGYVFKVDDWTRLNRFLILGSEGGSYYASERKLTLENVDCLQKCIKNHGVRTVNTIVEVSETGRAPKNDSAIFALALAASIGDDETRRHALASLPRVCRTGTHLISFSHDVENLRRFGRGLRKALANWYLSKSPDKVAYQVLKYRQRNGRSHRDLLRLCHPETDSKQHQAVFRWITCSTSLNARDVKRLDDKGKEFRVDHYPEIARVNLPRIVEGFEKVQATTSVKEVVTLIREYNLTHEMVPDQFMSSIDVWESLISVNIGTTALIRNLGRLTSIGAIAPMSEMARIVAAKLSDTNAIKKDRVHPLNTLIALNTYRQGHGVKGSLSWTPVHTIIDALDEAFYAGFQAVQPTGKNHLLALDLSASMTWTQNRIKNTFINCREAAAAMAMVTARTESNWHCMGFSHQLIDLDISPKMRLDAVIDRIGSQSVGGTNCSLPMQYAESNNIKVDTFIVYTDNETYYGGIHPYQALLSYRRKVNAQAKLIVVGMASNGFTIADPDDSGMMDVVGFDTATPALMAEFTKGNL